MLSIQYTKEGLKDLKYVIVKVELKTSESSSSSVETRGLFFGYRTLMSTGFVPPVEADELFLWLYKGRCVYLYNLKYYNIESIEVAISKHGKTTQITSYTGTEQTKAIAKIKLIKMALEKQKRIEESGLVNISTYDSLPALFKDDGEEPAHGTTEKPSTITSAANRRTPTGNIGTRTPPYSAPSNYSSYTPSPKKEIETSIIKRTTRYSISEAVTKMKEKIDEIKNNTYSSPKLKRIPADTEKKAADDEKEDHMPGKHRQAGFIPGTVEDEDDIYGYPGSCM